jgi:hypothetical protein
MLDKKPIRMTPNGPLRQYRPMPTSVGGNLESQLGSLGAQKQWNAARPDSSQNAGNLQAQLGSLRSQQQWNAARPEGGAPSHAENLQAQLGSRQPDGPLRQYRPMPTSGGLPTQLGSMPSNGGLPTQLGSMPSNGAQQQYTSPGRLSGGAVPPGMPEASGQPNGLEFQGTNDVQAKMNQRFYQEALNQGFEPSMILQFLRQKMGLE